MNSEVRAQPNIDERIEKLIADVYCTRFFRRRPSGHSLNTTLRDALCAVPPRLRLFLLWGVHKKEQVGADDHETIEFLSKFQQYLTQRLSVAINMTIVVCDTHAEVNGIASDAREPYVDGVISAVTTRGWSALRMSSLWEEGGISIQTVKSRAATLDVETYAPRLIQFAHHYYLGGDAVDGASQYLAARLLEAPLLERRFQGAIHVTPTEPSLRHLQPFLPEFYIWLRKRGCSVKPWFSRGPV